MSFAFEKLLVYQKSVDFADAICARTERFPRGYGRGEPISSFDCQYDRVGNRTAVLEADGSRPPRAVCP